MSEQREQQAPLAFDAGTPGVTDGTAPIPRTWDHSLTRRMRVPLHRVPIEDTPSPLSDLHLNRIVANAASGS